MSDVDDDLTVEDDDEVEGAGGYTNEIEVVRKLIENMIDGAGGYDIWFWSLYLVSRYAFDCFDDYR